MNTQVRMRLLHTMKDFALVVELQQKIWGMTLEIVSPHIMNAISHNGGSVIVAEVDDQNTKFLP